MDISGVFTAIVTPFKDNLTLDEEGFEILLERQVKSKVAGVVPVGTTGESATLSYEEHKKVVELCIEHISSKKTVIAGAGSNSTREAIDLAKHAENVGADAVLVITPYYNKPQQRGLVRHYKEVAAAVEIPVVVYNVPSRTGIDIAPETIREIAKIDNIAAIKEATGDISKISRIVELCSEDIAILSGNDELTLPILSLGGRGAISVASNVVPDEMSKLVEYGMEGDIKKAREIHYKLLPLFKALFLETNPAPVKEMLAELKVINRYVRPPLVEVENSTKERIRNVINDLKSEGVL